MGDHMGSWVDLIWISGRGLGCSTLSSKEVILRCIPLAPVLRPVVSGAMVDPVA